LITGKVRWTARVPGRCGQITNAGASYLVINRKVLDRRNGRVLWRTRGAEGAGTSTGSGAIAPIADGPTIIVVRRGVLEGRAPRSGRVRWTRRSPSIEESGVFVGPTRVVAIRRFAPGQTFVPGASTTATAWDRATGREKWSAEVPLPGYETSVTRRSLVIMEAGISRVQGLDIETGHQRWWTWLPAGGPESLGVGAGVAVVLGPGGTEAFDDASGSLLWSMPGLDQFDVLPERGLVTVSGRLVDIRSGVVRAEVPTSQSISYPVSNRRVVRATPRGYESVDADGHVVWTVSTPRGFAGEGTHLIGNDLVVIPDHCPR
jgi:hypothetical protein